MQSKNQVINARLSRLVLVPLIVVIVFSVFSYPAKAETSPIPYLPPGVETSPGDPTKGFDPETKENFYWDKDTHVWRNAKTGKAVGSYPVDRPGGSHCGRREISDTGIPYLPPGVETSLGDPAQGFDPNTGENFYWDKDTHVWRNAKTGKAVGSYPVDRPGGSQCGRREIKVPEASTKPKPSLGATIESVINVTGNNPYNPSNPLGGSTTTTTTSPPPPSTQCVYTYSDWGSCQSNNTQTRTVISTSPPGCTGTPVLTQSCTYLPPPTSCFHNGSFTGCGSGCGISGPLSISVSGSTVTASPFGDNGSQTFNVNGNTATSVNTNLTILGKQPHTCTISCSGVIHCQRTNNSSIQCDEQCTYQ